MSNTRRGLPLTSSRVEQIFPKLTTAQIRHVAAHGQIRKIERGEVLYEQGHSAAPFFAVVSGELEAVRPLFPVETLVTVYEPGQFTGEVGTLSGRGALFLVRASKPSEVIELDRHQMMTLIQTDAELGDILIRAFILRRVELIAAGVGDSVLIGSIHSPGTLRIKEFLMRNGQPYSYIDLERDPDVQKLLDSFHISASEIPVLICRGQLVLRNPSNQQIADCLGFFDVRDALSHHLSFCHHLSLIGLAVLIVLPWFVYPHLVFPTGEKSDC
jgi:thioredoxin reductase (NADPH)